MIYRYYYNIDRGTEILAMKKITKIDLSQKLDEICCHTSQNNICRAFIMYTDADVKPSKEQIKQFTTDCQTLIAKAADEVHKYVHEVQALLKAQGFPVEFFNVKRNSFNNDDNPFIHPTPQFFDFGDIKANSSETFKSVVVDLDAHAITIKK